MAFPSLAGYTFGRATTACLERMLEPVVESFTPVVARKIIKLRADPELERHNSKLRHKANEGTLSPEEDEDATHHRGDDG
jgi:hypothetical protein